MNHQMSAEAFLAFTAVQPADEGDRARTRRMVARYTPPEERGEVEAMLGVTA